MNQRSESHPEESTNAIADGLALPGVPLEDPDDIAALRAAIALRANAKGAGAPTDDFVAQLGERLLGTAAPARKTVSRRAVITGAIAAGTVAATALGATEAVRHRRRPTASELVPNDGEWVAVAKAEQLIPGGAQQFYSRGVLGFVSSKNDELNAVSGVCTHLGCVLHPNVVTGQLDCPCHRTSFRVDGTLAVHQLAAPPAPLPRLKVRRRDDDIEIFLPPSAAL